jgi:hypothetical protein
MNKYANMSKSQAGRDRLQNVPTEIILQRMNLLRAVLWDGMKECEGESKLQELIRQWEVLKGVYKDRTHPERKKTSIEGDVIVKLKPIGIRIRRI